MHHSGHLRTIVRSATDRLIGEKSPENLVSSLTPFGFSFPMTMLLPGGRHDNGMPKISQVKIIPTY